MLMGLPANSHLPKIIGRWIVVGAVLLLASSCATFEYHESKNTAAARLDDAENQKIDEEALLDVGIVVFDPGMGSLEEDAVAFQNVRQSEAVWFATQLKSTLQYSNVWGPVRTMPSANAVMDITITGEILESNGEFVKLRIDVTDATGSLWFSKEYQLTASTYAYNPEVSYGRDPFRTMFVEIANDLFEYRLALSKQQIVTIRSVSKVRFAREFVPAAFSGFLSESEGRYSLVRAPAANDPMIRRVEQIRVRNDLFLDVIQDYYRVFTGKMTHPYQEWRKASYKEVLYARQLKEQSRKEKIAGVASILAGLLAQTSNSGLARGAGHVGIFAGANLIYRGYAKQGEALIHSATVREVTAALEAELEPSVIDLEDRSVTLSGTVDDQFKEWRGILGKMFEAESGIAPGSLGEEGSEQSRLQQNRLLEDKATNVDNAEAQSGNE